MADEDDTQADSVGRATLAGRVALVTGASGGIGAAIARELAAAGSAVALGYGAHREPAEELAEKIHSGGGQAVVLGGDLRRADAAEELAAACEDALGPVDILIPNAGLSERLRLEEVGFDAWSDHLAVNLTAPFLLAQRLVPAMASRGWGRVLFVSSVAAFTGGVIGPHYAASKSALHGLTHSLAARFAGSGVTVNALAPALIEGTAMLPSSGPRGEQLTDLIPVGRLGRPGEVADLAIAVLGNGYVTNQVFAIDGGMHPR